MNETKMIRIMTFNCRRAVKFGYKPTKIDRLIMLRSPHVHTEISFSTRYGGISFSSTLRDGVKGCRFKMIEYSHPERWDAVHLPVTAVDEARMFSKACSMAGMSQAFPAVVHPDGTVETDSTNGCYYYPSHVKYDLIQGAALSYISKAKIVKPSKTKRVCNRACTDVLVTAHPKVVICNGRVQDYSGWTPSETDGMSRNYRRENY